MKIGFIGAGNMGGAILRGYAPAALIDGNEIFVSTRTEQVRKQFEQAYSNVTAKSRIEDLVAVCDIILLGVKPIAFDEVLKAVSSEYTEDKVIVSMAAGISLDFMEQYLGRTAKIIRVMPNTPALVNEAMIAICRNRNVDDGLFGHVLEVFTSVGVTEEVDEALFHCVIGVSGSSPAYTYMYIDALINAAVDNGMAPDKAKVFAAQSVLGAAKMVLENDISPEQLRINVCSPGGTTIEAVEVLKANRFEDKVKAGFNAAVTKSKKNDKIRVII